MQKKTKAATESGVYLVVVALVAILANVLSTQPGMHARMDTTKNERYTLSKGSGRLVAGLKKQITVKAYVTTGLAKLDAFVADLDDLMREYERASKGKFVYEKHIAKTEAEKEQAKEYKLREAAFGEGSEKGEDTAKIAQGYMGLVFLYGDQQEVIPILSPEQSEGLEFWISNKIREVRDKGDDNFRKIGVISGKDEIKLTDTNLTPSQGRGGPSMQSVIQQAFPYYKFENVDLKDGATTIDESLDGLIITQPGKDFNAKELRQIDKFMMRGNKGLVVFASAVNLKASDATMSTTLSTHGLEKLLTGYGVEMKKDAVFDWARHAKIPVMSQLGSAQWFRWHAVAHVQTLPGSKPEEQTLDTGFPAFFRLQELAFPFPSSLELKKEKQPTAKFRVVARTSETAWSQTEVSDVKPSEEWKPKPPLGTKAIAVAVEGKLKSAMGAGKAEDVEVPAEASAPSRVFVVASSQFLANPFARAGNGKAMGGKMGMMMPPVGGDQKLQMLAGPYLRAYLQATVLAFKNTLDWLTGDTELLATAAKLLGEPSLTYSKVARPKLTAADTDATIKAKDQEYRQARKAIQTKIEWILMLISPAMFAAFGIAYWQMRKRQVATL